MPEDMAIKPDGADLPPEGGSLRLVLPSSFMAVRQALLQISARLGPVGLDPNQDGDMQIVIAEALNNIVEHAFAGTEGIIEVSVNASPTALQIIITDSGVAMPDGKVPLGEIEEYPREPEEMPEGGFGWFLIHDLTEDLSYQRAEDRNILQFRLPLSPIN